MQMSEQLTDVFVKRMVRLSKAMLKIYLNIGRTLSDIRTPSKSWYALDPGLNTDHSYPLRQYKIKIIHNSEFHSQKRSAGNKNDPLGIHIAILTPYPYRTVGDLLPAITFLQRVNRGDTI
jgi:hypothetical protein